MSAHHTRLTLQADERAHHAFLPGCEDIPGYDRPETSLSLLTEVAKGTGQMTLEDRLDLGDDEWTVEDLVPYNPLNSRAKADDIAAREHFATAASSAPTRKEANKIRRLSSEQALHAEENKTVLEQLARGGDVHTLYMDAEGWEAMLQQQVVRRIRQIAADPESNPQTVREILLMDRVIAELEKIGRAARRSLSQAREKQREEAAKLPRVRKDRPLIAA